MRNTFIKCVFSNTVLSHNSLIFLRPKKCDYCGKCDYLGDREKKPQIPSCITQFLKINKYLRLFGV